MAQHMTVQEAIKERNITCLDVYSRKSRDTVDKEGLEKHHDILVAFAEKLGVKYRIWEEQETSETLNRPMLNEIREGIKKGTINCVVVYRMDRVTRKTTDSERLLSEFKFYNVVLIEAHRETVIDYNDVLRNKLEAVMNDLYLEGSKLVLEAGKQKSVAIYGNHLGECPLGYSYNVDTKKLEPNDKAFLVQKIFDMYLDGDSTRTIAVKLNKEGHRTRKGAIFTATATNRILKNDKYIGIQTYGKTEWWKTPTGQQRAKKRVQEDWIVYVDAHEAIIDKDLFAKVQTLIVDNCLVPTKARKRSHTFTGLIRCGKCGMALSFTTRQLTEGTRVHLKTCAKFNYVLGERCGNSNRPMKEFYDFTIKKLWSEVRPAILYVNSEFAKNNSKGFMSNQKVKLASVVKQRNQLNTQIDNLLDMQLMNGMSDRLMQKQNQLEQQLKSLDKEIELLNESDESDGALAHAEVFMEMSKDVIDINMMSLKHHDDAELNKFLKRYIDHIDHVHGKDLVIHYKQEVHTAIQMFTESNQKNVVETSV